MKPKEKETSLMVAERQLVLASQRYTRAKTAADKANKELAASEESYNNAQLVLNNAVATLRARSKVSPSGVA
jgi:hypothetical protein